MKVLSVVGNRPQFIKSGPVSAALREAGIEEVGLHTGQHWDPELSDVFYAELGLPRAALPARPPHRRRRGDAARDRRRARSRSGPTGRSSSATRTRRSPAPRRRGDAGVPVAHVEAGLRSGDLSMPEEHNRIAVDAHGRAPALPRRALARDAARRGRRRAAIDVVGDVMADACFRFAPIARERSRVLERHELEPGAYVAATIHREANVQPERLARIVDGLGRIGERVVFPAHPRTRATLARARMPPNVEVLVAARLPRHGRARLAGARDRHRLGRACRRRRTGTAFPASPRGRRPSGSTPSSSARTSSSTTIPSGSRRRSRRRGCPTSGRRSTATATPRNGSRLALPTVAEARQLRRRGHRRRLRRRAARGHVRRGRLPRPPRRRRSRTSSTRSTAASRHIEDVPSERLAPLVEQRARPRDDRLRRAARRGRDPDRAADAALAPARARPLDRRERRARASPRCCARASSSCSSRRRGRARRARCCSRSSRRAAA